MTEKKVLIITYYWPPSGGSGVQRWLKFVKYLPHYGYIPYVFTPENPSFDLKDESLMKDVPMEAEVIHFPIWEPYKLFFGLSRMLGSDATPRNTNLVSTEKKSAFQKFSTWLRANFLIPDPRVFWVRPSVKFLEDFVSDNKIKTIITTGPPHSVHLIGLGLKKKHPSLKWVADFRDPWSEWGLLDSLGVGSLARKIHKRLEGKVLRKADNVITITPFYVRKFSTLSGRHVDLVTNGFDEEDFVNLHVRKTEKFVIRHVGIVNEKCNPRPFMHALKQMMASDREFSSTVMVDFVGDVHPDFRAFVAADAELNAITSFTPPVAHKTLLEYYGTSSLLLLILTGYRDAEGYMPGKLFEYIATGIPVLGVGPTNGDAAEMMKASGTGVMIDGENSSSIKDYLRKNFDQWKAPFTERENSAELSNFSRRAATGKLAALLDKQN